MITLEKIFFFAFISISPLLSQELPGNGGQNTSEEQKLEQLYNKMMLTFPREVKAKIDSASQKIADKSQSEKSSSGSLQYTKSNAMVNQLPDDLRLQVEKTISEMEVRKNERVLQFREYKKTK